MTSDPRLEQVLASAIERARDVKAAPLGVILDTPVRRVADGESPLGNLFTDALRESVPGADVVVHNITGGLRADLPPGPLTYGSVYETFPFDNRVVQLDLTGADLERVLALRLQGSRGAVGISGIRVQARCAGNALSVTLLRPSGRPIRDDEWLIVVTTDFLATGGDGIFSPILPLPGFVIPDDAPPAREVFADWLRRRGGRLREDQLVDREHPRWVYPGPLPVSCGAQ